MKSPIRILAVDGGGVGGIIPARILERLNAKRPGLIDRADVVAGTSTGGLIALGLAGGKTPADLCSLYLDRAKDIFSPSLRRYAVFRLWMAKFSPSGLREVVSEVYGDKTLGDLTAKSLLVPVTAVARADASHHPAGVFLSTAFRLTNDASLEKYASSRWKCADVALATAAAPTYFPAHSLEAPGGKGEWVCWDGGVSANNPGLAATGEILRLQLGENKKPVRLGPEEMHDIRVLSLGTGYRNIDIGAADWGVTQTAQPLISALMDVSVGSSAFLLRQILGVKALRLNMKLEENYELDDPDVVPRLSDRAQAFVAGGLKAIDQPDGTKEDVDDWLNRCWFDDAD